MGGMFHLLILKTWLQKAYGAVLGTLGELLVNPRTHLCLK
jgi:hypothetical protein